RGQTRLGQGRERRKAPVLGPEKSAMAGGERVEGRMVGSDAFADVAKIAVQEQPRQLVPDSAERFQMIPQEIQTIAYGYERDPIRPLGEIPCHGAEPQRLPRLERDAQAVAVSDSQGRLEHSCQCQSTSSGASGASKGHAEFTKL